jgi:hypothetical protein
MFRTLSPAHHEEFNWDSQAYLPVEVTNLGDFDALTGEWALGARRNKARKADPEVQRLREELQKQKLTEVMLEQLIVERTLELKTVRRDLAQFILRNEEVFKGSELWQASQDALLKDKQERVIEQELSLDDAPIERMTSLRTPSEYEDDELSQSRLEERKTPTSSLKPPKYYRSGSPGAGVVRMLSS